MGVFKKIDVCKILVESEEFVKSCGVKVVYLGIFENGVCKGMMGWEDVQIVFKVFFLI